MSYGYVVPRLDTDAFNCPNCGAYAQQRQSYTADDLGTTIRGVRVTWCARCENFALWREGGMICPAGSAVPMPEPDMPDDVQSDYLEARDIANRSPRGGAALLRLAMQKLMVALGEGGKDLNKDIGSLVKKGLPLKIQQALDAVRVIGNNAVHPGELDLRRLPSPSAPGRGVGRGSRWC